MKKRTILIIIFLLTGGLVLLGINKGETKQMTYTKSKNADMLSMMLQNEDGSYEETTRSEWPTEGYTLNTSLSFCENGGTISWDDAKKIVVMDSDASDKCYVYFDLGISKNFAEYIKSLYTGVQGENNLYYHYGLKNGAGDCSYRYAGSSETTNNFVCFGYDSEDGTCLNDNLYRIIGVFNDNVKLIKYDYETGDLLGMDGDYLGTINNPASQSNYKGSLEKMGRYNWNYKAQNVRLSTWSNSLLNKINLNTAYLNNISKIWSDKIVEFLWRVGGNSGSNINSVEVSSVYKNEILNPKQEISYNAKVGLMYVSDYLYAASPLYWTYKGYDTETTDYRAAINNNWMYMGYDEWMITPLVDSGNLAVVVNSDGSVAFSYTDSSRSLRPAFYLESSVKVKSGNGTMSTPYIIE